MPELLLIDGGKGQVSKAYEALNELQVEGVKIVGVAKGVERRPGYETLIFPNTKKTVNLAEHSLALHLIQQICNFFQIEIVCTHKSDTIPSLETQLTHDVIAMLTSFAGKLHRSRRGQQNLS